MRSMTASSPRPRRGAPDADFFRRRSLPDPPADRNAVELEATVDAVVFSNAEGSFTILRGSDDGGRKVVLKGALAHVHVGEHLTCRGRWQEHSEHGWSFQVDHADVSQPHTQVGMVAYLESNLQGIGPIWAKAIVDTFGDDTITQLDADPQALFNVTTPSGRKMSAKQIRELMRHWHDSAAEREVSLFLTSHGVTPGFAKKIIKQYGDTALRRLEGDPYCMVEIKGIGFKMADRIARNMGVPLESPRRIQAGIVFCVEEGESSGHCYLREDELATSVRDNLFDGAGGAYEDAPAAGENIVVATRLDTIVDGQLEELVRERRLVMDDAQDGRRFYLPETYWIERRLATNVRELLSTLPAVDVEPPERPREGDFIPNDGQWQAIEHALTSRISLITGLPGTGKTTLVKLLLEVIDGAELRLDDEQARYVLASPTGKAARRLQEATGRKAQTIHRLLQWAPSEGGFLHDEGNPLTARFIIVDETSMVDLKLADALLRAVGPTSHLVLVGDADQLPPVGAGKVFDDLIESGCVPSVRLTEIFRQAARSMIVRNAHRIVAGEHTFKNRSDASVQLGVAPEELDDDFFFVHRDDPEDVATTIVEFAADRIPKKYGLDPMRDVLVLAPMKKGPCGLEALNTKLQLRLNKDGAKIGVKDLRVGDRVIQTRNNYDLEVMNGEVGVLRAWDAEASMATVEFAEDRVVEVPRTSLDSFLLAYAISVHRSQGSQAPAVICAVATSHWIMLTRSLVNTAITRAQRLCVCVGQTRAINHAVRNVDSRTRNAALAERVRAGGAPTATKRAEAPVDPFAGDTIIGVLTD
ncbi:MAG: ATP-dependent RecD-like helicase [Thermoleophilia bacterium]|nr:ATP-dependent RecD-like helicase [Thermoleophilia bacterium]